MLNKLDIGRAIKEFRTKLGLKQTEFAEIMQSYGYHVSHASISRYEKGIDEPRVSFFLALMDLYKKEIKEIIPDNINQRAISSIASSKSMRYKHLHTG